MNAPKLSECEEQSVQKAFYQLKHILLCMGVEDVTFDEGDNLQAVD